jgi:hypothetical protein
MRLFVLVGLFVLFSATTAQSASVDVRSVDRAVPVVQQQTGFDRVCASGIGEVVCDFFFDDPVQVRVIEQLCATGVLDAEVCIDAPATLPATCPVLVNVAQAYTSAVCEDVVRGEFCYGSDIISTDPGELVSSPGDIGNLLPFTAAEVAGYALEAGGFGIALANSHADLPVGLVPEREGLRILVFGDVRIEDGFTEAEALVLPDAAIAVTAGDTEIEVFDQPASFGEQVIVGSVPARTQLQADLLSDDGAWLRVLFAYENLFGNRMTAWVRVSDVVLSGQDALAGLDRAGAAAGPPKEAFYFAPGESIPPCSPLGSLVVVQAPYGIETTFHVNGATITTIGSLILNFETEDNALHMRVFAGDGVVQLQPSTDPLLLPPGYTARIALLPDRQNMGADGQPNDYSIADGAIWNDIRPVRVNEWEGLLALEGLPEPLLNQVVDVPVCTESEPNGVCDLRYDRVTDSELIAALCKNNLLPADIAVCQP